MDASRSLDYGTLAAAPSLHGVSLPGWIYSDPDFLQAEKEHVFLSSWQIVCHLNDIPNAGDYQTLDFLGEPLVAVRGQEGAVRVFFNVCRHRAARILDGDSGRCARRPSTADYDIESQC